MINFMAKEDSVARKNGKYLLLFVFCFLVAALQAKSPVYGQAKTFTVSLKNVTLKEVISYVEKNSQYVFFFKPEVIKQSTQISVSLKNATVKHLLDKVSEQANIVYEMKERQIVLKEKKVSEQSVSQKKLLLQSLIKDAQGNPNILASIQLKKTGTILTMPLLITAVIVTTITSPINPNIILSPCSSKNTSTTIPLLFLKSRKRPYFQQLRLLSLLLLIMLWLLFRLQ